MGSYKVTVTQKVELLEGSFSRLQKSLKKLNPSQIIVIYDASTKDHLKRYSSVLKLAPVHFVPLKVSESLKTFKTFEQLLEKLIYFGADKKTVLLAMGGGVVGDLVGLVAHTYLRGLPWISIPTTLLAQVDSGVGGKNAVNLQLKNAVGTIYQPAIIFLDFLFLNTLSIRDFQSSLGEILKYSLLDTSVRLSPQLIQDILQHKESQALRRLIVQCARLKMRFVNHDPWDQTGLRQKLNLGHTFGHALEKLTDYKRYRHGEAVLIGIKFALIVSYQRGFIKFKDFRSMMTELNLFQIPKIPKNLTAKDFYQTSLKDKKSYSQMVQMVLVKKRGITENPVRVDFKEFCMAFEVLKDFEL